MNPLMAQFSSAPQDSPQQGAMNISNSPAAASATSLLGGICKRRSPLPEWPSLTACSVVDASERETDELKDMETAAIVDRALPQDSGSDSPPQQPKPGVKHALLRWMSPGCLFFTCFVFQNFCLYIATYYYIMWMDRLVANVDVRSMNGTAAFLANATKGKEHLASSFEQGALQDSVADFLDKQFKIPTIQLDAISGLIPVLVLFGTAVNRDLRLWTRCCLCGALLAVLKGVLGAATIVPDSIGWEGCKARLGEDGLKYFRTASDLNFEHSIFSSIKELLVLEFLGVEDGKGGRHHVRFCADMMFSGHTYVCATFSLGLYDLLRNGTAKFGPCLRLTIRLLAGLVLACVVLGDVTLILMNRFHYTMDVIVAVVLVALTFTNPAVSIAVEEYVLWVVGGRSLLRNCHDSASAEGEGVTGMDERERGALLVPPCCLPFCCFQGRYHLYERPNLHEAFLKHLEFVDGCYEEQLALKDTRLKDWEEACSRVEAQVLKLQKQLEDASIAEQKLKESHREQLEKKDHAQNSLLRQLEAMEGKLSLLDQRYRESEANFKAKEEQNLERSRLLEARAEEEQARRHLAEQREKALAVEVSVRSRQLARATASSERDIGSKRRALSVPLEEPDEESSVPGARRLLETFAEVVLSKKNCNTKSSSNNNNNNSTAGALPSREPSDQATATPAAASPVSPPPVDAVDD